MDMGCVARVRRKWKGNGLKEMLLWAGWDWQGAMGIVVAMGAVALEKVLPVEDLGFTSQLALESLCPPILTIQATGMAQPGIFSLQKPRTSVRAVISKGIKSAS